jgi:hypothetical protein
MFATRTRAILPVLRAQGLTWRVDGSFLEVSIGMTNLSNEPTVPDHLIIEAAAFGAFVPTVPVGRVPVTSFEPFERRRITTRLPVADVRRVADRQLAAMSIRDPRDTMALAVLSPSEHWAGNLKVHFERAPGRAVEAHRALGLEIPAGRDSRLNFFVGCDWSYRIGAAASAPDWRVRVEWTDGAPRGWLIVAPPPGVGSRGEVEVRVTRTSDNKTVPITFTFETVPVDAGWGA